MEGPVETPEEQPSNRSCRGSGIFWRVMGFQQQPASGDSVNELNAEITVEIAP